MFAKITKVKILTIAIMIALILQYSIGIDSMYVYADDNGTEITLDNSGEDVSVEEKEKDAETGSEADPVEESEADIEEDAAEDAEAGSDTDASEETADGLEADVETGSEFYADAADEQEADAKAGSDADTSEETADGLEADVETGSESDADAADEQEADTQAGSDADTAEETADGLEADVETGSEFDTDAADEQEADAEAGSDAEATEEPKAESEAGSDADAAEEQEEDADKTVKQTVKVGGAEITAEYDKAAFDGDVTFFADKLTDKQMKKSDGAIDELVSEDITATTLFAFDLYFKDQSGKRLEPTDDVKISIEFDKSQNNGVPGKLHVVHIDHDGKAEYIDNASISDDASRTEFTSNSFSEYDVIAESGEIVPVSTEADIQAIVAALNANGGKKVIELTQDVPLAENHVIDLSKGELTILGGGNQLKATFYLKGDAVLNLGIDGYGKTMNVIPSRTDYGVANTVGTSTLNLYNGVTMGPAGPVGSAGGITAERNSVINMYGGTITDCKSMSLAGGVYVTNYAVFNMRGGTIKDCIGMNGGAVGIAGGRPLGGNGAGMAAFNMSGGTISNCVDNYMGGGAVGTYSYYPATITISGGTIEKCSSSAPYGGGISLVTTMSSVFEMSGGTIVGNKCPNGYGGGIIVSSGGNTSDIKFTGGVIKGNEAIYGGGMFLFTSATISDGFGLHNNTAYGAGDDIYNNGAAVTLGTVDTSATLEDCGHPITGWYDDANDRWSYKECTGNDDYLELFTHTGEVYSEEYGLKAAHGELYTVKWVNYDDSELETDKNVPYGTTPSYDGQTPTKEPTAEYTYEFSGWDPEISEVTNDITYTAKYTQKAREYTVRFDSNGGSSVSPVTVKYGDPVERPADPTRSGYMFDGWLLDGEPYDFSTPVTGPITLTAKWTKDPDPVDPDDPDDPDDPPAPVDPDEPDDPADPVVTPDDEPEDDMTPPAPDDPETQEPVITPEGDDGDAAETPVAPAEPAAPAVPAAAPAARAAAPAGQAAAPAAPQPAPAAQPAIVDDPVPQAQPAEIDDPEPPKVEQPEEGHWALLNLIAAALATIGAVVALFRKKEEDDEDYDDDDDRSSKRKMNAYKAAGAIAAAASIIAFLLTEDMSLPMALADKWTILMAVLFAGQAATAYGVKKASEDDSEEYEEAE